MGQYFKLVNLDKKEFIDPFTLDSLSKFFEITSNGRITGLLIYLLRKSDNTGGGDVKNLGELKFCGRWAGDRILLIGDYDSSGLYDKVTTENGWKDIGSEALKEFVSIKHSETHIPDAIIIAKGKNENK